MAPPGSKKPVDEPVPTISTTTSLSPTAVEFTPRSGYDSGAPVAEPSERTPTTSTLLTPRQRDDDAHILPSTPRTARARSKGRNLRPPQDPVLGSDEGPEGDKLRELRKKNERLVEENKGWSEKYGQEEKEHDELKEKFGESERQRRRLQQQTEDQSKEVDTAIQEAKELKQELERMRKENEEKERGFGELQEQYRKLDLLYQISDSEIADAEKKLTEVENERNELKATNLGLHNEMDAYEQEYEEKMVPYEQALDDQQLLQKVMQTFQEEFSELSKGVNLDEYLRQFRESMQSTRRLRRDESQASLASDRGEPYGRPGARGNRDVSGASLGDELNGEDLSGAESDDDDAEAADSAFDGADDTLTLNGQLDATQSETPSGHTNGVSSTYVATSSGAQTNSDVVVMTKAESDLLQRKIAQVDQLHKNYGQRIKTERDKYEKEWHLVVQLQQEVKKLKEGPDPVKLAQLEKDLKTAQQDLKTAKQDLKTAKRDLGKKIQEAENEKQTRHRADQEIYRLRDVEKNLCDTFNTADTAAKEAAKAAKELEKQLRDQVSELTTKVTGAEQAKKAAEEAKEKIATLSARVKAMEDSAPVPAADEESVLRSKITAPAQYNGGVAEIAAPPPVPDGNEESVLSSIITAPAQHNGGVAETAAEQTIKELKKQLETEKKSVEQAAQKKIKDAEQRIIGLEKKIRELEEQLETKQMTIDRLNEDIHDLDEAQDRQFESDRKHEKLTGDLKQESAGLKKRIAELENDIAEKTRQATEAAKAADTSTHEISQANQRNAKLRDEITQKTQQLDAAQQTRNQSQPEGTPCWHKLIFLIICGLLLGQWLYTSRENYLWLSANDRMAQYTLSRPAYVHGGFGWLVWAMSMVGGEGGVSLLRGDW